MDWYGLAQFVLALSTFAGVIIANLADKAAEHAKVSQQEVSEIKGLAVKTETQTNSRLSALDAKVAEHERKCVENLRLIAELKLALAEALRKKGE